LSFRGSFEELAITLKPSLYFLNAKGIDIRGNMGAGPLQKGISRWIPNEGFGCIGL
jgi:hypothetical protein